MASREEDPNGEMLGEGQSPSTSPHIRATRNDQVPDIDNLLPTDPHSEAEHPAPPTIVLPANDLDATPPSQPSISELAAVTGEVQVTEDPLDSGDQSTESSRDTASIESTPSESLESSPDSNPDKERGLGFPDRILPQLEERPARDDDRRSLPTSPTLRPTTPANHHPSISCPVSPQLQPTAPSRSPSPRRPTNPFRDSRSPATQEWFRRKRMDGETSVVLDELMQYQGLEEVKQQFLDIKSKVDICKEQGRDLSGQRFNVVFQGNPGTGKTTIARLYARFLREMEIIETDRIKETSGVKLATKGAKGTKDMLRRMVNDEGGVIFIDEAYQLVAGYLDGYGRQVLDLVLTYIENNIGKLVAIFVGYKDEMEPFFEHNPGLSSRIPYTINFADFNDAQLWNILEFNINKRYSRKMIAEDGLDGLYMRIAIRRLSQGRGSRSFGNARAIENLLDRIEQRQAQRLAREKRYGCKPNHFLLTKEDVIGPNPFEAAKKCPAWGELQELIGLKQVKDSVERMIGMINANYKRELSEQEPFKFSLNCLFVGAPGTGKTTVAKLYGQILAHLGYLSRGDVLLKTPADFIGECLGKSEAKTKKLLEASIGKILVIDEAYMLDAGDPHKEQDKFKTGVIDTIVSMVQGVPGEDRCIILVGYEDKLRDMFQNVNPGLSRRFPIDRPFRFENFNLEQLEQILRLKMKQQDLHTTPGAFNAARDVFERALMRPKFSNAGEVDVLLATAKMNYEKRQSQLPWDQQTYDGTIEDIDIDPNFGRASHPELNCNEMLRGRVHDSIIDRLVSYQRRYAGARKHGLNPRQQVPTNFIFKGYAGTGKTTTAKCMGQIFYDMGFLSTTEVIECAATDLVGQYVGQTAPKTRKKLQEGLGRVIFIDEAYRLMYGQYAAEAIDELIQFLTQSANAGRVVVILASRISEIHQLMMMRPELSNLFPEEIVFGHIPPEDCISLLERELRHDLIESEHGFLSDIRSDGYIKVKRLFKALEVLPSWSNARDVKTLAKKIVGKFLETDDPVAHQSRTVSSKLVIDCMSKTIIQQKDRLTLGYADNSLYLSPNAVRSEQPSGQAQDSTQNSIPPSVTTDICTPGMSGKGHADCSSGAEVKQNTTFAQIHGPASISPSGSSQPPDIERRNFDIRSYETDNHSHDDDDEAGFREMGVTDATWSDLHRAQEKERSHRLHQKNELARLERELLNAERELEEAGGEGSGTGGDGSGKDTSSCDQLRNEMMAIQRKMWEEEQTHKALQKMGRCPVGYLWTQVLGGYRCEGGGHFVTDDEVRRFLR